MNSLRITQTAATIAQLMGFSMPEDADKANEIVLSAAKKHFGDRYAEKVVLYNPDAVALWLYQKYTALFTPVICNSDMALPIESVMPSVTPVCFGSMYTGLVPEKHGITSYRKPVLRCPTLFDAAIAAGKKPIIISTRGDSITEIFKEREMDYIVCETPDECNERAVEVIRADKYDIIVVYNANYDDAMHKTGPESERSINAIKHNAKAFETLTEVAREAWRGKRIVTAFLPDHGCHEIDGQSGSHGLDMPEDMEIIHFYSFANR